MYQFLYDCVYDYHTHRSMHANVINHVYLSYFGTCVRVCARAYVHENEEVVEDEVDHDERIVAPRRRWNVTALNHGT